MGSSRTIVWFRRDLRIEDNPALAAAAKDGAVFPVYIWCPEEEGQFYPGRVSRWWLKQSLAHLGNSLKSLGAELVFIRTQSTFDALRDCINAIGATRVVFNHLYADKNSYHYVSLFMSDPVSLVRDHSIKDKLGELGISVKSYNADLLFEPWEIYDDEGHAFTTFNSYWDKCLHMHMEPVSHLRPWRLVPATAGTIKKCLVDELGLEDELEKASNSLLGRAWSPGWSNADKALMEFVERHLVHYSENSLKVGGNSTSLLSPYLHFGEVSVRKVFQSVLMKQLVWEEEENIKGKESVKRFLRSIGFREYSRYLCFNFPFTHERSLLGHLKYFPWNVNQAHFKSWRQGRTGYPLVDAGMRELWATGWMHNRIRVIASSFAVKVLLLPWRWGMKYFWDTLLDADLESDILGWQYISGSLPDGHQLERLDSPEIQGSKFDEEGEYVRQWLPELARMPTEWIHHPWDAPEIVLRSAGVELGINYPMPIIDLDKAKELLTSSIFKMWETEAAARASTSNGTTEVVGDNSDMTDNAGIPKVILREKAKATCPSISSNDQKVPSFHIVKRDLLSKKRSKCPEPDKLKHLNDGDLYSTAESSAAKKQATTSRCSFSVPQYSSSSEGNSIAQECESSEGLQMQIDLEKTPNKDIAKGS
ncbi:CRY2 [Linum grandiflorum]